MSNFSEKHWRHQSMLRSSKIHGHTWASGLNPEMLATKLASLDQRWGPRLGISIFSTNTETPQQCLFFSPHSSFEGVCLDSRHPDPRRVWKGGSQPHFLTPLRADRADPADPPMSSKSRILYMFLQQKMLRPHYCAMFF